MLQDLLAAAGRQEGGVVAISGVTASGKSELLHHLARLADGAGARYLPAAGSRSERALPLGIIRQLFRSAAPTSGAARGLALMLDEGALHTTFAECESDRTDTAAAQMLNGLCVALLNLAEEAPLVIAVDDVQHADMASLQCLLYLARRVRSSRAALVLTEGGPVHPPFRAELLSLSHCRRLTLKPLSAAGTAALLADHVEPGARRRLADACHAISGGNPLLVRALIEDNWAAGARTGQAPDPGDAFDQAVLRCLYRGTPEMRAVARAVAVLAGPAPLTLLSQLAGLESGAAAQARHALTAAGLLDAGRFRHQRIRHTVLKSLPPGERTALHRRAAQLLYAAGSAPATVARHLVAADTIDEPWEQAVLEEVAGRALTDGEPEFAIACLRLSWRAGTDHVQRDASRTMLARAEWRLNPLTARRHLDGIAEAIQAGRLTGRHAIIAVKHLLWAGQLTDALAALDQLDLDGTTDPDSVLELNVAKGWFACAHPPLLERLSRLPAPSDTADLRSLMVGPRLTASTVIASALTDPAGTGVVSGAEHILHRSHLDDSLMEPILAASLALIYTDRPGRAATAITAILDRSAGTPAPTWRTLFTWVRGEIALRQGDLRTAAAMAREALDEMTTQSWGIALGGALGTLVQATTAMGRYAEAAELLGRPVPEAVFQSIFGLHYLHARGRHDLACNRPHAALVNFQTCGDLMTRWRLNAPALVPWRTDAARALILLGDRRRARDLATEQLALAGDRYPRSRGASLRVLGLTTDLRQRRNTLRDAVDVLQGTGDHLELAYALADLSQTHYALGESNRARLVMRRAHRLAQECHAEPLRELLRPGLADSIPAARTADTAAAASEEPEPSNPLSEAELRVAVLAAQGDTNREIARKLYITISTVEQHLTRIYRKLNVNRRADLPGGLQFDLAED